MNKQIIYDCFCRYFYKFSLIVILLTCSISNAKAENTEGGINTSKISVTLQKRTLKDALHAIEQQSNVTFMYDEGTINLNRSINISLQNKSLETVLNELFKGTDIGYEIAGKQVVLAPKKSLDANQSVISTKKKTISGVIKDYANESVIGANIKIKGQQIGTISDINGHFSIEVAEDDAIEISFLGYKTHVVYVKGKNTLNIRLEEDTHLLGETVIVGYGTQKKISLTSAISSVGADELATTTNSNLSASLAGRLPGLTITQSSGAPGGDGAQMVIRGFGSTVYNNPLYVVDGIIRDYFPNIGSDDIESITVLKDATASAVYGVRGANGVIIVTTKRGSLQKPTVSINSSMSLTQNTEFPKFLNGPEYAYWYNKAQELDGIAVENRRFTQDQIERITNGDPKGVFGNTNWFDLLFKGTAPTYSNSVSVNGGSEHIKYYASLNAYNQRGIIAHTSYDRYTFRMNMDAKITKDFSVEMNAYGNENRTKGPTLDAGQDGIINQASSLFSQALMSYPYIPDTYEGIPTASLVNGKNQNPVNSRDNAGRKNIKSSSFQGNIAFKYDLPFIDGLSAKVNLAYDKGFTLKKSYMWSSYVNEFNLEKEAYTYKTAGYSSKDKASLQQWYADTEKQTIQSSLHYQNTFGKHEVSGLFLYEYVRDKGESMTAGREDFPIRDIMDLNYGETLNPNFGKGGHSYFHNAGYVFRANYAYDARYLLEFAARYDATPNFSASKRWGFFPSVSAGWRISEEGFFKEKFEKISNLKIRASVGKLGNDRVDGQRDSYKYLRYTTLSTSPAAVIGGDYTRKLTMSGGIPNLDITWESSIQSNFGIELEMWKGLLGVEVDAFYIYNKNILQGISGMYPPSIGGYHLAAMNLGKVANRGIELTLSHRHQVGDFNYNIRGTMGFARNKVLKTDEDPNVPKQLRRTGYSTGAKFGFISEGLFQTQEEIDKSAIYQGANRDEVKPGHAKMRDLNGDGIITTQDDWTRIGRSSTPELQFGLNFNGSYKGFDLNLFFQGAALADVALAGHYADRGFPAHTFYTRPFFVDGNSPRYLLEQSWTPENTNAKYERLSTRSSESGSWMSDFFLRDGSYLRLKNAQIGYTLPKQAISYLGLQKVRVYVSGSNLFTLDHLEGLDPEMPDVNQGYYPQQRIYEFGLNVVF